jgi:outer membrane protein TolC
LKKRVSTNEVDIWGRLRRATEAARADLLAAEDIRKAIVTTLVSDVAQSDRAGYGAAQYRKK